MLAPTAILSSVRDSHRINLGRTGNHVGSPDPTGLVDLRCRLLRPRSDRRPASRDERDPTARSGGRWAHRHRRFRGDPPSPGGRGTRRQPAGRGRVLRPDPLDAVAVRVTRRHRRGHRRRACGRDRRRPHRRRPEASRRAGPRGDAGQLAVPASRTRRRSCPSPTWRTRSTGPRRRPASRSPSRSSPMLRGGGAPPPRRSTPSRRGSRSSRVAGRPRRLLRRPRSLPRRASPWRSGTGSTA